MSILTPTCPLCGGPPAMVLDGWRQVLCGNDQCTLFFWDATKSLDENLMNARSIDPPHGE